MPTDEYDMTAEDLDPYVKRNEYSITFRDSSGNDYLNLSVKLSEDECEEFEDGLLSLIDRYK